MDHEQRCRDVINFPFSESDTVRKEAWLEINPSTERPSILTLIAVVMEADVGHGLVL